MSIHSEPSVPASARARVGTADELAEQLNGCGYAARVVRGEPVRVVGGGKRALVDGITVYADGFSLWQENGNYRDAIVSASKRSAGLQKMCADLEQAAAFICDTYADTTRDRT